MMDRSTHLVERAVAFLRSDAGLAAGAGADIVRQIAAAPLDRAAADTPCPAITLPSPLPPGSPIPDGARVDLETLLCAGLAVAGDGRSRVAEEFRVTVDRVLRGLRVARDGTDRTNLLLVTSARPGEGKTFTALNLAASIVQNGLGEALLVDTDDKTDSLTSQFGLTDAPGLLNLVANPALRVEDLLLPTAVEGLHYLPIGTRGLPAVETEVRRSINVAVERIARRFARRIVVLDGAPCLSSSNPITLAPLADQIIMVVEAERTRRGEIDAALDLIDACANIMLVLNKVQLATSSTFGAHHGALKP